MNDRPLVTIFSFFLITVLLAAILLVYGEAGFNVQDDLLLWQLRFPKIIVALMAGGMLAGSGLLLQVFFQNPLAGPDLLGINAGSCLGVAIAIMGASFLPAGIAPFGQTLMAMLGALSVFLLLTFLVRKNINRISLLILGLLIASFTASFISVLVNMTPSLQVKNFLMWSMGSFQGVTIEELPYFVGFGLLGLVFLAILPKGLNQFIIGENYARSMGVDVKRFKTILILVCSFLVAIVTAYCGPIGFIGIIAPHIARTFMKRSDIRLVMPAVFFVGSSLALFTELILIFTSEYSLATNSILGLIGAPVIALYLYRDRRVV
ncbi:iron ABC transporter permease [Bacteriovorax stolpii]|uniref:Iron ABC transporter n=1 Tax=Bacteriovorax stolpii TaxID=960 RepID=A0A2K9NMR5_BACTC|nr:iron ABC transporter permease [Bacteriovorax stolpii]AUN96798.1 iron ABC transporter [Bacteriovorax stolpii]QDK43271.1 iron ABC transporter permease [Bacteriovorax stolpii]TDP53075.1 iron complex transport system permease protein [Bacteriovorax stolpii]